MDKKLEVKNLQVSFRTQGGILKAVRDISFDLYKGETFAIVGESGSGKSVTSKSIMGILSGNSIVEGGEILYNGQDLLKISEEDFHKIRGDKIAMIFQDPMSSLNPIMKVGQQLTEAMILKNKTSKKNARNIFNSTLKLLNSNIDEIKTNDQEKIGTKNTIHTFDNFCIESTKVEGKYNESYANLVELDLIIENTIFLISKKQKISISKIIKDVKKYINLSYNTYLLIKDDELSQIIDSLSSIKHNDNQNETDELNKALIKLNVIVKKTLTKEKPNFFRLGYYLYCNPTADVSSIPVSELDDMTRKYLDDNYMLSFIELGSLGIKQSHLKSIDLKKQVVIAAKNLLNYIKTDDLNHKDLNLKIHELCSLVQKSIDHLDPKKNSVEYTFSSAIKTEINDYFNGIHNNPIQEKKYNVQKAKYDHLIEIGKTPDWKLVPPNIVDIELAKNNIIHVIDGIIKSCTNDIDKSELFNEKEKMVELIDYLKEQASKVVSEMTHSMAKAKALKLLEEVGIPEPNIRFNQYPFEFSGGMRQRIVIAIALSADPDILICDEPTTALDVTIQAQILELINKLKQERNLSVIFITHNLGVVANMADRIAVMYAGKIVEVGTANDIFYDPRHPYTWALLSSMPDLETKEKLEAITGTPPNMIYPPKGDAFAERNKFALEIDFQLQPPLFKVSDTHYAATWLLHPDAPKVELPKIIQRRVQRVNKEMAKNE